MIRKEANDHTVACMDHQYQIQSLVVSRITTARVIDDSQEEIQEIFREEIQEILHNRESGRRSSSTQFQADSNCSKICTSHRHVT